ncbi:MAG: glycerophosphodiester phosphodiesterase family protein [Anaerolineaceae bacterium]|nr:glycerophosphodiester phosphodiesterase family protein [Anaerolineaceae bacterium]
MTLLQSLPQPAIFAHRGASAYAPENTLAAFELAVRQGADAIELDAKLSADGRVIVIHDQTVDRTTGVSGSVQNLTLAQLRELDAGSFFAPEFRGEKIPTLEEVFESFAKRALINVELSNHYTPRDNLVEEVCKTIKRFNIQDQILFSSFHPTSLAKAQALLPDIPRGLLANTDFRAAIVRSFVFNFGNYQALHPHLKTASPQQVRRVHRIRRRVHVYTVNEERHLRKLFHWGVDGVFTDDPPLAVRVRGEKG